jgi:hypothetical protein
VNAQDLISRFSTYRNSTPRRRGFSGVVGSFERRDAATGLLRYERPGGGVGFARKITPSRISRGETVPALVGGFAGYAWADKRF